MGCKIRIYFIFCYQIQVHLPSERSQVEPKFKLLKVRSSTDAEGEDKLQLKLQYYRMTLVLHQVRHKKKKKKKKYPELG